MNIHGNDYGSNDHVALAADLHTLTRRGFRVMPLYQMVEQWLSRSDVFEGQRIAALTCDDGADFDFLDLVHPVAGVQRSFLNILRDFQLANPAAQPSLHLTSFVIVSPLARSMLDRTCMIGRSWWNDSWWKAAAGSGLMGIANHSWDHNHESLQGEDYPPDGRGTFRSIDSQAAAERQVSRAHAYLQREVPNPAARLFAYPYGERSDFLVKDFFPDATRNPGVLAAFTTDGQFVTRASSRWELPRFTCGHDWHSTAELEALLDAAAES